MAGYSIASITGGKEFCEIFAVWFYPMYIYIVSLIICRSVKDIVIHLVDVVQK